MKAPLLAILLGITIAGADDISSGGKAEPKGLPQTTTHASPVEGVMPDWNICWEFHVIALPAKLAFPLLPELRDETTVGAGWEKLQGMIKKGDAAMVLDTGGKVMQSGEATYFQGEEVRYPIEFEGPAVVEPAKGVDPAKIPAAKPGEPISVAYLPSTFEVRKVGISLTLRTVTSDDGKRLKVEFEADHTWFTKWDEFDVGRLSTNEKIVYKQPRFTVVRRKATSGMVAGERLLLSAHPLADAPEKTELFFLRVWTMPRKPVEAK